MTISRSRLAAHGAVILSVVVWLPWAGGQGLPGMEWREASGEQMEGREEVGDEGEGGEEAGEVWVEEFRGVRWEGEDWRQWAGGGVVAQVEREVSRWRGKAMVRRDFEHFLDGVLEAFERGGWPVVEAELVGREGWDEGWVRVRLTVGRYQRIGVLPVETIEREWLEKSLRLQPGEVVTADGLEQELEWLGRSPFVRSRLLVSPAEVMGGVDVLLALEEGRNWECEVGYDTRLPEVLGDHRMWWGGTWVTRGQQLWGWQSQISEDPGVYQAHAMRWELPLAGRREVWRWDLAWAAVDARQRVAGFAVDSGGESWATSLRWVKRVAGWRGWEPTVSFGAEYQRHDQFLLFGSSDLSAGVVEMVHGVAGWEVRKDGEAGGRRWDVQAVWGPGGLAGRNGDEDFAKYQAEADSTYLILRGGFEAWRREDWGELRMRMRGQWADGVMLPANQWVMGGAGTVRGAGEREFLGDRGWQGTFEYQTPWVDGGVWGRWAGVLFRDEAWLDGGVDDGARPGSVGVGLRWRLREGVEVDADYGWRSDADGGGGVVTVRCRF